MKEKDKAILKALRGTVRFWQKLTGIRVDNPVLSTYDINIQEFVVVATNSPSAIGGLRRIREICEVLNS